MRLDLVLYKLAIAIRWIVKSKKNMNYDYSLNFVQRELLSGLGLNLGHSILPHENYHHEDNISISIYIYIYIYSSLKKKFTHYIGIILVRVKKYI